MSYRPREIEAWTNLWFFHPFSRLLARFLSKTPVHPNAVSIVGVVLGLSAAYSYYHYQDGYFVFYAFAFMLAWHVLDGTDGMLARMTGKATVFGRALDGVSDYTVFLSVYLSLAAAMYAEGNPNGLWLWFLGGWSHIIQAGAYERQRDIYSFWVYSGNAGKIPGEEPITPVPVFNHLHRAYLYVQNKMDASHKLVQTGFEMKMGDRRREMAAAEYKRMYAPFLHIWSLLSANSYTIAIFLMTWLFGPMYYFILEFTLFNLLLIILLLVKRRLDNKFLAYLKTLEPQQKA